MGLSTIALWRCPCRSLKQFWTLNEFLQTLLRSLRPAHAIRAGIFLSQHPEREEVYLTRRKGFVKLAIQGGAGERMTQ